MLQVIQVMLNSFTNGGVTSTTANLSPTCDARLQGLPLEVARDLSSKDLDEVRPFRSRPCQAHLAAQYIDELRKLVQSCQSQNSTQPGHSLVVKCRPSSIAHVD